MHRVTWRDSGGGKAMLYANSHTLVIYNMTLDNISGLETKGYRFVDKKILT